MPRWLGQLAPGALVIALALWGIEQAVHHGLVKRSLLPAPSDIGLVLWDLLADGQVTGPLSETLARLAIGFAIGATLGIALGLAMGYWPRLYRLFEPLIELLRPIPKAALVPALVLFLGVDNAMKITSIALAVFFPVVINTVQGARGVDPVLINTARTLGVGPFSLLRKVILPASAPFIFAGMRLSIALGLILAVISEMIAGTGGIGFLIIDMQRAFRVRQMYAWIVILAVVGYLLNFLLLLAEQRMLFWYRTTQRT
ncbi:MAG: ABC transporter permease [Xanthobacteraceae bacterium]|jgi:ABC-type nitrate/sulfonate/bicarbonate transport system permease component